MLSKLLIIFLVSMTSYADQDFNDAILRKGPESEHTSCAFDTFEKKILSKLRALEDKFDELVENVSHKLATKTTQNIDETEEVCETRNYLGCKEKVVEGGYKFTPYYRLDELVHTTLWYSEDEDGGGVSFKMHLGVRTPMKAFIRLSAVPLVGNNDTVFEIGVGENNNKTHLNLVRRNAAVHVNHNNYTEIKESLKNMYTPNVLSSDRYSTFYLLVNNGTLQFAKEEITNRATNSKSIATYITYTDLRFKTLQYFSFASSYPATFFYDCPP